jgi:oxygen-dependent protoporphyrinogen oxidase
MWNVAILGGGVTGLTAAYELERHAAAADRPVSWCLIEGGSRWGGKVVSERQGDFLVEGGPDAVIPQKPWALELMKELGLSERLLRSNDASKTTYVLKNGKLVAVPPGLALLVPGEIETFLRSPILPWSAKLRMLLERWVPPRRVETDESVGDFVRRRLGTAALEHLAEPLLAHIHMGNVDRLSLEGTYPRLGAAERRFGSLSSAARAAKSRRAGPPGGPLFWSLRGGMGELVETLVGKLPPEALRLGQRAVGLARADGGSWELTLEDGRQIEAERLLLALPSFAAAELVESFDPELAARFAAIRYVSLATVSLGFRRSDISHPLDGFGFLVPSREGRKILASTWTSAKYDLRAGPDEVLLRVFLGGASNEEVLECGDEELIETAASELREILGTTAAPVMTCLHRWPRGYPQYEVGHGERVAAIEAALPEGISIAGSPYTGVGLPDCIRSAREAAKRLANDCGVTACEVDGGVVAC